MKFRCIVADAARDAIDFTKSLQFDGDRGRRGFRYETEITGSERPVDSEIRNKKWHFIFQRAGQNDSMKSFSLRCIGSLCAALLFSGCGLFQRKTQENLDKPDRNEPKLVGRIASVPLDKRFVLIQSFGKWNVETGAILTTRGADNQSANLRVTGESLGQFAAADLQSGSLEVGDAVYFRHVPKPNEPSGDPESHIENSPPSPELLENQPLPKY